MLVLIVLGLVFLALGAALIFERFGVRQRILEILPLEESGSVHGVARMLLTVVGAVWVIIALSALLIAIVGN